MTSKRAATTAASVLALAFATAACSPPEKRLVDQYFGAINQEDNQTLSSFAAVRFDKKVQDWKITSVSPESKETAALPALQEKLQQGETDIEKNKRDAQLWASDTEVYKQIDEVKELRKKNAAIPARLQAVAQKYDDFSHRERDLKKAAAEAKLAFEQEKRYATLSLGQSAVDGAEKSVAELLSKSVELLLTVDGQQQNYTMHLRRYNLTGEAGGRLISRWVVYKIEPKT